MPSNDIKGHSAWYNTWYNFSQKFTLKFFCITKGIRFTKTNTQCADRTAKKKQPGIRCFDWDTQTPKHPKCRKNSKYWAIEDDLIDGISIPATWWQQQAPWSKALPPTCKSTAIPDCRASQTSYCFVTLNHEADKRSARWSGVILTALLGEPAAG